MDLQTRKLNLIIYLAQLQDEHLFGEIEEYILSGLEKEDHSELTPFNAETLVNSIERSEDNFKNGGFKVQEDLENLV